ncbi:MAG: hypothetical protein L0241_32065 [Planctomycetia bacterium]|nr:hypothetical protein [Planctomycetia bacterium]
MKLSGFSACVSRTLSVALLLLAVSGVATADPPPFKPTDFPPSTADPSLTIKVGDKLTLGGPKSANFLPNERMDVFVVPHRIWLEGDPLGDNAVKRIRIKSDAKGSLPLTDLWKADKAGQFDIIVDYDGNGRFSYSLDSLDGVVVQAK